MGITKNFEDILNKKYGCFTAIGLKKYSRRTGVICKCVCGNIKVMLPDSLTKHSHESCGECWNGVSYKDYIGKKYGQFVVVSATKGAKGPKAKCKCSCGTVKEFTISQLEKKRHIICGKCYNGIPLKDYIGKRYGKLNVVNIKKHTAVCKCTCGTVKEFPIWVLEKKLHSSCGKCFNGVSHKEYIGKKFGHLTVVSLEEKAGKKKETIAVCKCDCGNVTKKTLSHLLRNNNSTCGKCYAGVSYKKYIGAVFGHYTIKKIHLKNGKPYAVCSCKCGKIEERYFSYLIRNKINSCGCLQKSFRTLKKISFGQLSVVKASKNNVGGLRLICKCSCGNEVEVLESDLFTGKVTCCKECLDLK